MAYPLVSDHILWCFTLDPCPLLVDLEHSQAQHTFQYPPHLIHNPSLNPRHGVQMIGQPPSRDYTGTQELADLIRAYLPPPGTNLPRPEGVKAPSVRMRKKYNYQPFQHALFVMDPGIQVPYANRATLVYQWQLRLEFEQARPRRPLPTPRSKSNGPRRGSNWGQLATLPSQPMLGGLGRSNTPLRPNGI
ncbi:MAG: hypothetical protein ACLQGP_27025 [Isosphaeraceae bacterium]